MESPRMVRSSRSLIGTARRGVTLGRPLGGPEPRVAHDLRTADGEVLGKAVVPSLSARRIDLAVIFWVYSRCVRGRSGMPIPEYASTAHPEGMVPGAASAE
eukprot:9520265-Alexandrium_andersonii.AAC.1